MRRLTLSLIAAIGGFLNGFAQTGLIKSDAVPELVAYYHSDGADYATDFIELDQTVLTGLADASSPWGFTAWENDATNKDKIGAAGQSVGEEAVWAATSIAPYTVYFYDSDKILLTSDPIWFTRDNIAQAKYIKISIPYNNFRLYLDGEIYKQSIKAQDKVSMTTIGEYSIAVKKVMPSIPVKWDDFQFTGNIREGVFKFFPMAPSDDYSALCKNNWTVDADGKNVAATGTAVGTELDKVFDSKYINTENFSYTPDDSYSTNASSDFAQALNLPNTFKMYIEKAAWDAVSQMWVDDVYQFSAANAPNRYDLVKTAAPYKDDEFSLISHTLSANATNHATMITYTYPSVSTRIKNGKWIVSGDYEATDEAFTFSTRFVDPFARPTQATLRKGYNTYSFSTTYGVDPDAAGIELQYFQISGQYQPSSPYVDNLKNMLANGIWKIDGDVTITSIVGKEYYAITNSATIATDGAIKLANKFSDERNRPNDNTQLTIKVPLVNILGGKYDFTYKFYINRGKEGNNQNIAFEDDQVKSICVSNWDTDGDGELSMTEAAAVSELGNVFSGNSAITSFNELVYFTGLSSIRENTFKNCISLTSVIIPKNVRSIYFDNPFAGCSNLEKISVADGNSYYTSPDNCNAIIDNSRKKLVAGCKNTVFPSDVKSIGDYAFYGCSGLTTLKIPDSVTEIGYMAFEGCSSLKNISIPNGVTEIRDRTFQGCSSLTSVTIPNSVTEIEDRVFSGCSSLTAIVIPNGITEIRESSFRGCSSLTSVSIPNSVTNIFQYAFADCSSLESITIPSGVTVISNSAFENCSSLKAINIPSNVEFIGFEDTGYWYGLSNPFAGCSSLTSITVESGNANYDSRNGCNAIIRKSDNTLITGCKNTVIPSNVTSISGSAFYDCSSLTSVTIPSNVTSIGEATFSGCTNLKTIVVESGNANYDSRDNCNAIIRKSDNTLIAGCMNTVIPSDVTSISSYAFDNCSGLTAINIPSSVMEIGNNPFFRCSNLSSITVDNENINYDSRDNCNAIIRKSDNILITGCKNTVIPSSVVSIDDAFYGCNGLTAITIPSSVTTIGQSAFYGCDNLVTVKMESETPVTIMEETFSNRTNATLYVPAGSSVAYQSANYWKDFNNIVEFWENFNITFADATVKSLCVVNWDTDGDGELSTGEAAAVKSLGDVFQQSDITSFNELQYFTGLTSICDFAFNYCQNLTSITIPSNVASIGKYAFSSCKLTSITIPTSVTTIGEGAFEGCWGLKSINIPSSVKTIEGNPFINCYSITSITVESGNTNYDSRNNCNAIIRKSDDTLITGCGNTVIPDNVKSIGDNAFVGVDLTSVTIPNSVVSIGERTFYGNWSLRHITIPSSVKEIGKWAFAGCRNVIYVKVESSTPIAEIPSVFSNIYNTTLYVPVGCKSTYEAANYWKEFGKIVEYRENDILFADSNVKAICVANWDTNGDGELSTDEAAAVSDLGSAFQESSITTFDELQYFTGLTSIGASAFSECYDLVSVTIPSSVTSIGNEAFLFCGLRTLTIPSSVTNIANFAFGLCTALSSITVEDGNSNYDSRDNCNAIIRKSDNTLIAGCANTVIPNSVTSIGERAFYNCFMTSITIPSSVTSIGNLAFIHCNELTSINIPSSVTSINYGTFAYCSSLTSITIPSSVTEIGEYAFYECDKLTNVTVEFSTPLTIAENTFTNQSDATLLVPDGTKALFNEAEVWKEFGYIYEINGDRPYAEFDEETGTLTFAMGHKEYGGNVHQIDYKTGWLGYWDEEKGEYYDYAENILKVVFDASFAGFCPSSTNWWFSGCSNIQTIEGLENLNTSKIRSMRYMFSDCSSLASFTIPNNLSFIDLGTFYGCSSLTSITIPSGVTEIGPYAFEDCDNLVRVTVENATPVDITEYVFTNRTNATLYVPKGSKAAYEAADYWKEFKEIVEYEAEDNYILGDVNGNGGVDIGDAVSIVNYLVGKESTTFVEKAADTNKNGQIDIGDAVTIVNFLVGKTPSLSRTIDDVWDEREPQ